MAITGVFGSTSTVAATSVQNVRVLGSGAGAQNGTVLTTAGVNGWPTQTQAVMLPANSLKTGGGYLAVNFEWSATMTAGSSATNIFWFTFAGQTLGSTFSVSANSYRGSLRLRNVDNHTQYVTVAAADGAASAVPFSLSCDLTLDQTFGFMANGSGGVNSIGLVGWSAEIHNGSLTATSQPLIAGKKIWYGVNHHPSYGNTPPRADLISAMKALKFNTMRVDWNGISSSAGGVDYTTWIMDMASAMQADVGSLNLCVLVNAGFGSGGVTFADETAAYTYWKNQASYIAALVTPLGVTMFEEGNEMDASTVIRRSPVASFQGTTVDDFSLGAASRWNLMRGALRGVYDGIKGVNPNALVGSNAFTNASIWASDALWNGVDPNGSTGNAQVRWDWTNWHLYTEGDATNVDYSGFNAKFNLLQYIHNAYGKPIVITEYNPAEATNSTQTKLVTWLSSWYALQDTFNIAGTVWYDWFDSPYQIANSDVAPSSMNSIGAALTAFISAHPALK